MGKGKNAIPDRWEMYKPVVNHVAGTRFLPFKVPLKEEILRPRVPDESEWFTPARILEMEPKLMAIIDLTDTHRYYNPEEFTRRGVCYKKINIPAGHGKMPGNGKFREFCHAVDEFTNRLPEDALIGVHCTHGLNRTGYLICKYMVTRMEIDPEEAINRFEIARGHKMERDNYLASIRDQSEMTTVPHVQQQDYSRAVPDRRSNESNWRTEQRVEPGMAHEHKRAYKPQKIKPIHRRDRTNSTHRSPYPKNSHRESYDSQAPDSNNSHHGSSLDHNDVPTYRQSSNDRYNQAGGSNNSHYRSPMDYNNAPTHRQDYNNAPTYRQSSNNDRYSQAGSSNSSHYGSPLDHNEAPTYRQSSNRRNKWTRRQ